MIGQKFGLLTVLSQVEKRGSTGHIYWNCICDCGKEKAIRSSSLRTGHEKSCGCQKTAKIGYGTRSDYTGYRFGKLLAVRKQGGTYLCLCDCGTEKSVRSGLLASGNTKSCGCDKPYKGKAARRRL